MPTIERDPSLAGWTSAWCRVGLGLFQLALALILFYLLLEIWPTQDRDANGALPDGDVSILGEDFTLDPEVQFLGIVMISAAIGSLSYMVTSFSAYVGNRQLERSYTWWYLLRPVVGVSLALILYFLTRGGLLSTNSDAGELNPFGIAGIAGMTGLFSRQASQKLAEVFNTLFATRAETPQTAPLARDDD